MMSRTRYSDLARAATDIARIIVLGGTMLASIPAFAADDVQAWGIIVADVRVARQTQLTLDVIARSNPDQIALGQLVLRGGVRQQVSDGTHIALTYGWFHTLVEDGIDTTEHRFTEALTQRLLRRGPWSADARLLLEERLPDTGGALGVRVRPRLRVTRTLAPGFEAQISEEAIVAVNATSWGQRSGFTANRVGGQLHWVLDRHFGISPGYQWQYIPRPGVPARNDHVVQVAVDAHF